MRILAIDPGSEESALLAYDPHAGDIRVFGILRNSEVLSILRECREPGDVLVVEDTKAYTLPKKAGGAFFPEQVRIATFWAGRFVERWGGSYALIDRRDVKRRLCGTHIAGDAQVRDAILDRFGGSRKRAVGKKSAPGPLYGVKRDLFSALAVALAYVDEVSVPHSLDCRP